MSLPPSTPHIESRRRLIAERSATTIRRIPPRIAATCNERHEAPRYAKRAPQRRNASGGDFAARNASRGDSPARNASRGDFGMASEAEYRRNSGSGTAGRAARRESRVAGIPRRGNRVAVIQGGAHGRKSPQLGIRDGGECGVARIPNSGDSAARKASRGDSAALNRAVGIRDDRLQDARVRSVAKKEGVPNGHPLMNL